MSLQQTARVRKNRTQPQLCSCINFLSQPEWCLPPSSSVDLCVSVIIHRLTVNLFQVLLFLWEVCYLCKVCCSLLLPVFLGFTVNLCLGVHLYLFSLRRVYNILYPYSRNLSLELPIIKVKGDVLFLLGKGKNGLTVIALKFSLLSPGFGFWFFTAFTVGSGFLCCCCGCCRFTLSVIFVLVGGLVEVFIDFAVLLVPI